MRRRTRQQDHEPGRDWIIESRRLIQPANLSCREIRVSGRLREFDFRPRGSAEPRRLTEPVATRTVESGRSRVARDLRTGGILPPPGQRRQDAAVTARIAGLIRLSCSLEFFE